MKKVMLLLLVICINKTVTAQTDTTLQKFLQINYTAYIGHKVDSLVKALPTYYNDMKILPSHRGDYGDVLVISFPNNVSVWIQVKQFKYMNPWLNKTNSNQSPTVNWKINLFKKETIAFTIIYQANTCWKGCEYDPRIYP